MWCQWIESYFEKCVLYSVKDIRYRDMTHLYILCLRNLVSKTEWKYYTLFIVPISSKWSGTYITRWYNICTRYVKRMSLAQAGDMITPRKTKSLSLCSSARVSSCTTQINKNKWYDDVLIHLDIRYLYIWQRRTIFF